MRRAARKDLLALTLITIAVRLVWLSRGIRVTSDGLVYLAAARNLVFHHIFSHGQGTTDLVPTVSHPPLYPALIALLWHGRPAPLATVALLQVVLSAATVALLYLTARDRFGRAVALVAAAALALAPMTSHYTTLILTETLFTFLLMLGTFWWGRKRALLCGIAFGLAALTRTTMLPFLLLLLLVLLLPGWRERWRVHLSIALVGLALSSIWIVRDFVVAGRFVPVATGSGQNLLFGTIETSLTGGLYWTGSRWTTEQREIPVFQADEALPEASRDRARARRAVERIAADPLGWLLVRAKQYPKFFLDTGPYVLDPDNNPAAAPPRTSRLLSLLVKVVFVAGNLFVFALAALGLLLERGRFVSLAHITLFPLYLSAIHLPMWIEPRYSLPMMPMVAIFAAVALLRLARVAKDQGRLRAARALLWPAQKDSLRASAPEHDE
ncbi:MAG TPA: glycosyltransferase family 39 protein [Pyrinomonadaceae bacterium]|jgi:4-amino-4-deoxy-L-arabinose transferase-like glycosyltransferase